MNSAGCIARHYASVLGNAFGSLATVDKQKTCIIDPIPGKVFVNTSYTFISQGLSSTDAMRVILCQASSIKKNTKQNCKRQVQRRIWTYIVHGSHLIVLN